jgi:phage host-nuclease inhibitor protein Gam
VTSEEKTINNQAKDIATLKREMIRRGDKIATLKAALIKLDALMADIDKLKNDCHKYCQPNGAVPPSNAYSVGEVDVSMVHGPRP